MADATPTTRHSETSARHEARRPDLSVPERLKLVLRLLEEAPGLPTTLERRVRLITCESLIHFCALELGLIIGDDVELIAQGWVR